MKYTYRYTGTEEKHLPHQGVMVRENGEIVTVNEPINHPEFELVEEKPQEEENKE